MLVNRGLQVLLPPDLPTTVVRRIGEFHGVQPDHTSLAKYIRLSLGGVLHDAYVLRESKHFVVCLMKCGATLRVSREDLGGLEWDLDPDSNPHCVSQLTADWFSAATEAPRCKDVATIEVYPVDMEEQQQGEGDKKVRAQPPRSCHRRVRLLATGESKLRPLGAPRFVYAKMFFPYLQFNVDPFPEGYMREQAAYSILPFCSPAVAPTCHYANFQENTGSYCAILEDVSTLACLERHPRLTADDDVLVVADRVFPVMERIFNALALLHGRFLRRDEEAVREDEKEAARVGSKTQHPEKDLRQGFVHPRVCHAMFQMALANQPDLQPLLDRVFEMALLESDQTETTSDDAAPMDSSPKKVIPLTGIEKAMEMHKAYRGGPPGSAQQLRYSTRRMSSFTGNAAVEDVKEYVSVNSATYHSVTMVHGRVIPEHIRFQADPQVIPNTVFIDWKYSGIGPFEVDLLQAFALLHEIPSVRRKHLYIPLLKAYTAQLQLFYQIKRDIVHILCNMRDIALLLLASEPFEWNGDGAMLDEIILLHDELCELTTKRAVMLLRDELKQEEAKANEEKK